MDTRTSPIRLRISQLQDVLASHGVHALLVPSADPHLSEYLPGRWQGREWLSGFTGSMATLVISLDEAALFADSRYWVQAEAEIAGTGIGPRARLVAIGEARIEVVALHGCHGLRRTQEVPGPEHRLADLDLLSDSGKKRGLAMDHRIQKRHRIDRDHRFAAGIRLHLDHAESLQA